MTQIDHILYIAEDDSPQDHAIARAVAMARRSQAKLTCFDMVPEEPPMLSLISGSVKAADFMTWLKSEKTRKLGDLVAPHNFDDQVTVSVAEGSKKYLEAIKAVLKQPIDMIIKPVEDPDWIDRLLGSEDMHLLRKSPCPVWLIKPDERPEYNNIVATIDLDVDDSLPHAAPLNHAILDLAVDIAVANSAQLHVVHAWDAPEAQYIRDIAEDPDKAEREVTEGAKARHNNAAQDMMTWLRNRVGQETFDYIAPRLHLPQGKAHTQIPKTAKALSADLVVMGTVARTGIPGLIIGNTAEAILNQLNCSLIAMKPPGFETPVVPD